MNKPQEHINNLLEEGWFFGNTLKNKTKSCKSILRSNSDPCYSSSSTKEDRLNQKLSDNKNGLIRAPSLPISLEKNKDMKYELLLEEGEEEENDEYEPRMGDLIRQATMSPLSKKFCRRLDRTPSLSPFRGTSKGLSVVSSVQNGSIKGMKQNGGNSKNKTPKKLDKSNMNISSKINGPKIQHLDKNKPKKRNNGPETMGLEGFKDLGLVSPNVKQEILPTLQRRASLDSPTHIQASKAKKPYVSESWRKASSAFLGTPSVPKWGDQKAEASQDVKAQIKFWARAVAYNVRQEC